MKEQKAKKDDYEKALSSYGEAMKEYRKGKYEKAAEMLGSFIEKYPSDKELVDRAEIYLSIIKERKEGKKSTIPLKTFDDYYQYGVFKVNEGNYEEGLKLLEKAQELNPKEAKIFFLKAEVLCLMGQMDVCLENLKKAIQLDNFFGILAQNEADFQPLWEDKKFKLITRLT